MDIQEGPPTGDQLKSLLEYIGGHNAGKLIMGARDTSDALAKLKEDAELFQRPVVSRHLVRYLQLELIGINVQVVDWHEGKVAVGDNESEILKLLKAIPKPS